MSSIQLKTLFGSRTGVHVYQLPLIGGIVLYLAPNQSLMGMLQGSEANCVYASVQQAHYGADKSHQGKRPNKKIVDSVLNLEECYNGTE